MKLKVELNNVRKIGSLSAEFKSGNVYLVKGKNEQGKTSFIKAITSMLNGNVKKEDLKRGEQKGEISGLITGADRQTYKVTYSLKEGKNPTVKLITPTLDVKNKKSSVADIFNYHSMTVEEFLGLGLTEPGRRKQMELVLDTLPNDVKEEIIVLDDNYNKDYDSRRETGNLLKVIKEESPSSLTDNEKELIEKLPSWEEWLVKAEQEYSEMRDKKIRAEEELKRNDDNLTQARLKKTHLEEQIALLQKQLDEVINEIDVLENSNLEVEITDEMLAVKENELKDNKQIIEDVRILDRRNDEYLKYKTRIDDLTSKYETLTNKLTEYQKRKKEIISKHLSLDHLVIEHGQLFYKEGDNLFPINENNVSFSRGAKILMTLLKEINKNYPIITLSKGHEFDSNSLEELKQFAEENDAVVLIEWVTDGVLEYEILEK